MQPLPSANLVRRDSQNSASFEESPRSINSARSSECPSTGETKTDTVFTSTLSISRSSTRSSFGKASPTQSPTNGSLAAFEAQELALGATIMANLQITQEQKARDDVQYKIKRMNSLRGLSKELNHIKHELQAPTYDMLKNEGFKLLSIEAIERMSPEERCQLHQKLIAELKLFHLPQSKNDTQEKRQAELEHMRTCVQSIEIVQKTIRDRRLIAFIENNTPLSDFLKGTELSEKDKSALLDQTIMRPLILASECIIDPKDLFGLIFQAIQLPLKEKSPRDPRTWLLLFCENWLRDNFGTYSARRAEPQIRLITQYCITMAEEGIKKRASNIGQLLNSALSPIAEHKLSVPSSAKSSIAFAEIVKEICAKSLKEPYEKIVEKVAQDLWYYQITLYCQLSEKLLITAKWKDPSLGHERTPREFLNVVTISNKLADYIVDTIISKQNPEASIRLIRFFLDVAKFLYERKDYATLFSIVTALSNGHVAGLKLWNEVYKKKEYKKLHKELEERLFSPINNHKAFRAQMQTNVEKYRKAKADKSLLYLPCWAILKRDIEFFNQNNPVLNVPGKDPDYNYSKLLSIYTTLSSLFVPQEGWKNMLREKLFSYTYATDLVTMCLGYNALDMAGRNALLKPSDP